MEVILEKEEGIPWRTRESAGQRSPRGRSHGVETGGLMRGSALDTGDQRLIFTLSR